MMESIPSTVLDEVEEILDYIDGHAPDGDEASKLAERAYKLLHAARRPNRIVNKGSDG